MLNVLLPGKVKVIQLYIDKPAEKMARCCGRLVHQCEPRPACQSGDQRQSTPMALVSSADYDQIGNSLWRTAYYAGAPCLRAANALVLLAPHIPMMFMGEEFGATQPFLYFTSHDNAELVAAIREGRREEFSKFEKFSDVSISAVIPDSNDEDTFLSSIPEVSGDSSVINSCIEWEQWTRTLLSIRHRQIIPRLAGAHALEASSRGPGAVTARWKMADNTVLAIAINLDSEAVALKLDDVAQTGGADVIFELAMYWPTSRRAACRPLVLSLSWNQPHEDLTSTAYECPHHTTELLPSLQTRFLPLNVHSTAPQCIAVSLLIILHP